ncbi:MAG: cysteine sulfinate desulfinase [Bdellovibrionales bacterium RIFOXYB1_FULL_37_110]|nr:MAG: cysteine sulfinate desulfinase [Bdellovibrionales bacterium RIFOXYA1_FULL_38_20]OFZ49290.1 MAG: cysteine sulfinate desulfinase [Bdellovibrionales bacterium RIFOXYC1_FULL_37_79]OFZ57751.1 MAG: cysteine sulfinate desulfinase [Bdellovibrionales bacterium RIFOXYB1_FULL_37_110]OFZ61551.1 MAG: cysteine sulfinate desulfinase [Bdellovibrionales bacterium RIFOXYD1_FULL_36_51]
MESSVLLKPPSRDDPDMIKIRNDFPFFSGANPITEKIIYLDNAATTLKPRVMLDELLNYYQFETANIHRSNHHLASISTSKFEETRTALKCFLNASSTNEIIFTKSATESINLIASSLGKSILHPDDTILLSQMEHHSNIVPWQLIAKTTGARIQVVPMNDDGELDLMEYKKMLNERVKLVSIVHISNTLGTINPVAEMITLAHEFGAYFILDAAQSFLHEKIDVQLLDPDFLVCSAHKALGSTGLGILYGKKSLLESMPPYMGGGEMIHHVSFEKTLYNDLPYKFEAGTPPIGQVIAFKKSLEYILSIGLEKIQQYENALLSYATHALTQIPNLRIIGNAQKKSAIISFLLGNIHPSDVGTLLDKQGLALRVGTHCTEPLMTRLKIPGTVRASFAFYNTLEEVDSLKHALIKIQDFY